MKELIFATGNKSKIDRFYDKLKEQGVELIGIKDLNIKLEAEENGKNEIENATIKAEECYKKTKKASLGMDDALYLEGVPEDRQPGQFVRRVNGKELSDEEMIEHYIDLVNEFGKEGKLDAKWVYGMCLINEKGEKHTYTWTKENFYMVNTRSDVINERYPLNSISKYKGIDKYFTDVTEEDKNSLKVDESDVIDFIIGSL